MITQLSPLVKATLKGLHVAVSLSSSSLMCRILFHVWCCCFFLSFGFVDFFSFTLSFILRTWFLFKVPLVQKTKHVQSPFDVLWLQQISSLLSFLLMGVFSHSQFTLPIHSRKKCVFFFVFVFLTAKKKFKKRKKQFEFFYFDAWISKFIRYFILIIKSLGFK